MPPGMIKKVIAVKNVGRFLNSARSPNPEFSRYVVISGANAYGKTTLCSVLRSLQKGDAAEILGRQTLGTTEAPTVEILLQSGEVARFDGKSWNRTLPELAI